MARRKDCAAAPVVAGSGVLADDAVRRYQPDLYGARSPEAAIRWLRDRAAWREAHPGAVLPQMSSLDLTMVGIYYVRGEIGEDVYRADRSAPVDRSTGRR